MPTLQWIGKDKVINHHQDVPFRLLDHQYGALADGTQTTEPADSGNRIIHGDNLEALKALLPEYENKVKCIYIDPPYNTGNEGWVYNDNVNDPKIKKWLSQVVGKEGEDLSRHDKWLCMMYPRLKLLHKLLADDGIIFISIDDNEISYLRIVMDEIFGRAQFVTEFIWKSRVSEDARAVTGVSNDHEYILTYRKTDLVKLRGVEKDLTKFSNPDNDPRGPWRSADVTGLATKEQRPNLHYDLVNPTTGDIYPPPHKGWRFDKNTMAKRVSEGRILFPASPDGRPRQKVFSDEMASQYKSISSVITSTSTAEGTKIIGSILGQGVFDFPKPVALPEMLIGQVTDPHDPDCIILDSFAGSGTTAHAVLKLNQQDGGNRKFILTEMEDYAEHITAERVKRVMKGYASQPGTGGSFDYYTLGEAVFTASGELNEQAGLAGLRRYIYYAETKQPLPAPSNDDNDAFLAQHDNTAYYFHYDPDAVTTLNHNFLATMRTRAGQYIIYADNCLLPAEFMTRHGIIFKKIPRDISRF
ncbi:site-specific DNA-methyltransferase [Hymenobacter mucosus]|uniref:site-specific DNA-methyltransferase (adenine-specific) n=1 Tax=Hymenobacter mucosus TaxID=1411120 RepID=A0A238ZXW9_9BACT|nr:site-specific DNA-methyltransferase [Hymenobacter mucosus]SNR87982.1 adenine-specific DNA-methyltransferase [Hymenobacter mucosus]